MLHRLRALQVLGIGLGLAATLALSGCGGSHNDAGGASSAGGGGTTSGGSNSDELLVYVRCLRSQGMDLPDPKPGQTLGQWFQGANIDTAQFREANTKCADKLPAGVRERASSPETQDQLVKFAQCMRENGVDMPDPKGGQVDFGNLDRNSPQFKKAEEICRRRVPIGQGGS